MAVPLFATCSMCHEVWMDREGFLSDPRVDVVGYQANFDDLEAGLFLFNHAKRGCESTLAVEVGRFEGLAPGPIYKESLHGTDECPDYCLRQEELRSCPLPCECAYVRDVLQVMRNWKKVAAR
jgi:hypothetical protein